MKDAKGHGSDARGAGGQFQTSTGISRAARERQAMLALVDRRKFTPDRTSIRNINPPAMYAPPYRAPGTVPNARGERTDMPHHRGVDAATLGKKLGG